MRAFAAFASRQHALDMADAEPKRVETVFWKLAQRSWQGNQAEHTSNIERLLKEGLDVNAMRSASLPGELERAPCSMLHLACRQKHSIVARYLIERGADVNLCTADGLTPVLFAMQMGIRRSERRYSRICNLLDMLAKHGADFEHVSVDGSNALMVWASTRTDDVSEAWQILKHLVQAGVNLGSAITDSDGNTALMLAAGNSGVRMTQMMSMASELRPRVDVSQGLRARNTRGETCLHLLAGRGLNWRSEHARGDRSTRSKLVEMLIDTTDTLHVADNTGRTVAQMLSTGTSSSLRVANFPVLPAANRELLSVVSHGSSLRAVRDAAELVVDINAQNY